MHKSSVEVPGARTSSPNHRATRAGSRTSHWNPKRGLAAMNDERSLYERIAARLAANPSLAKAIGTPPPELREVQAVSGSRWTNTSTASESEDTAAGRDRYLQS